MKTPYSLVLLVVVCAPALLLGCSSSSSNAGGSDGGPKDSSSTGDSGGDVIINNSNCVPPGTPNNSQGFGGYCSPNGGQCVTAGPDGSGALCTADFMGTPGNAWFCTFPCSAGFDCGPGLSCITQASSGQAGCVPTSCGFLAGDGGGSTSDAGAGD